MNYWLSFILLVSKRDSSKFLKFLDCDPEGTILALLSANCGSIDKVCEGLGLFKCKIV